MNSLTQNLQAAGLNPIVIDENTDMSTLPTPDTENAVETAISRFLNGAKALEELASYDPQLVVGVLGGGAGTTRDTFELLFQAEKYGARVALFGRKINLAESQVAQTISGTAIGAGVGSVVSTVINGTPLSAIVGANGVWSLNIPAALLGALGDGQQVLNLNLTDAERAPSKADNHITRAHWGSALDTTA